ncbi:MAG: alpha-L-fucosidase [Gammaproteobacteria bacterium]|nr:alpha-L-fucosidase [Gammaproteobacteria bacterium]
MLWAARALSVCGIAAATPAVAMPPNFADVAPSPQQVRWQDLEFGVIVHFGTNTFLGLEWGDGTAKPSVFNPDALDAEQWVEAAQGAGAKYIVLVAKHHDGFCLWPTEESDYSVKSSPWKGGKGDLVAEVAAAARKHGMQFGVYLSPWDRHEPRYKDSAAYDDYYESQVGDLASHYGQLVEFWLDGAGSGGHVYDFPRYVEQLRVYQPNTLVFADVALFDYGDIRWVGNEDGFIPYENWNVIDRHGPLRWRPAEVDTPLRKGHWFGGVDDEGLLKSVAELMKTYEESIGRGGQLMLGIAPNRHGLLPPSDVARLREFGAAINARYGNNLVRGHHRTDDDNRERALDDNPDTFWSAPAGSHHANVEVRFDRPVTFDRAMTLEWLEGGQRVRQYQVEVWAGNGWKTIARAQAIGHKKIDTFEPVTATRVRLNLLSTTDAAQIREFALYDSHFNESPSRVKAGAAVP